jgi:hypothetical protein
MFDLILLHQEVLRFIRNALNLVELHCLPLTRLAIPYVPLLYSNFDKDPCTVCLILCRTYILLCGLLCYLVLLDVVHTPVMVQTSIAFFVLIALSTTRYL